MSWLKENLYSYVVDANNSGQRVDKFLTEQLSIISRSKIQQLISIGQLRVNNQVISDRNYQVKLGDEISLSIPESSPTKMKPKNMHLDIIYEDEYLLVIDKPAGISVHPGAGNYDDTIVNVLLHYTKGKLSNLGGEDRPGIVHRLDKNTSGLMVVAKDDITHAYLSLALAKREIKRHYIALAFGLLETKSGKIETLIARSNKDRTKMEVSQNRGKYAITLYRVIDSYYSQISLVECVLETGRTHQIRVHMAHIKHPLIGDQTYGRNLNFSLNHLPQELKEEIKQIKRQALHARKLEFVHPYTKAKISLTSPKSFEFMPEIMRIIDFSKI